MANYNIYIDQTGGPKTFPTIEIEYPENTVTGVGHTSGNPLDLEIGDTLTFQNADTSTGAGTTVISSLGIFTDNSDINLLTNTASTFQVIVASGGTTADTITFNKTTAAGTATEQFFYVERQAASSIVSPTSTNVTTETQAINTATVAYDVTFNLSNAGSGGTYEYAIEQGDSTPDNWTAMPSDTATSVTVSFNRTSNPGTIYAQARRSATDTSAIRSVAGLDFWPPANISVNNATIAENFSGSYSATIIGGYYPGSPYEAYAVADVSGYTTNSQIVANAIDRLAPYTGQQFEIPAAELPTAGNTKTYYLYAFRYNNSPDRGGAGLYIEGNSFTITRLAGIEDTPVNRDHGNNPWVVLQDNPKITYAAPEPNTTIYVNDPGASLSARFTTGSAPQRGTFSSVLNAQYVSANKPIHFITQGAQYAVAPTTLVGQKFAHYATRNLPADIRVWNPDASNTATITVYSDAVSNSGIYGTSSLVSGSATLAVPSLSRRIWDHSSNATWIFFTSTIPVVATAKGTAGDFFIMSPMAQYVYKRRQGNSGIVEDGSAPSTNGAFVAFDTSGSAVQSIEIGDGAGGDAMQPVGDVNISNTYAFGDTLRDFAIVSPNNQKIVCEYYSGGSWNIGEYFEVTGASASSPVGILRRGNEGFYVAGGTNGTVVFNSAQIWRWRGEQPFFLGFNDSGTDEEANFGYTTNYTAPVINTVTDNGGSPTATVTVNLTSNGSGGVLKYAQASVNTPPRPQDSSGSSSWQTSNQFTQAQGTTRYYFASQAENFSGAFDSEVKTLAAADNTPENYQNLAGDVSDAPLSTQHYATFGVNIAGTTSPGNAFLIGIQVDNGTSISTNNGQWSTNGTTWNSSGGSINQNQSVYFRGQSASNSATTTTHSLTIGDTTHSFLTSTVGGDGTIPVDGGTSQYGVAVYDNDGSSLVLSPTTRYICKVAGPSTFTFTGPNQSANFVVDMTDLTTSNSDISFVGSGGTQVQATRYSGGWTLSSVVATTVTVMALRF